MGKNITAIKCDCSTNPDLDGFWLREQLEEDFASLGFPKEDWLSYLFGHLFSDYDEWNAKIEDAFINNDSIVSMKLKLGHDFVVVTKLYK